MVAVATPAAPNPRAIAAAKAARRARTSRRRRRIPTATVVVKCDPDFLGMGEMYAYVEEVRGIADDLKLVIWDAVQAGLHAAFDAHGNPAVGIDWASIHRSLPDYLRGKVVVDQVITPAPVAG